MRTRTKVLVGVGGVGLAAALIARQRAANGLDAPNQLDETDLDLRADLEGEDHWITSADGAELVVHTSGPQDGPVVVLAHCWTGSQQTWAPVARRLTAAGCRVVRWDQRGHGRSRAGHKGHSIEGLADDLACVLDELDLHDVVLVGHSMGGMTVQAFATHHHAAFHERARGVVLVATAARSVSGPADDRASALIRSARLERLVERPAAGRIMMRSTFGRAAHRHHLETTAADFVATPGHVRGDFLEAMQAMDLRDGVSTIDVPTTIVVGSRDTLTPVARSRELAGTIPGSTIEILPGFGHMLPYEAPDTVTQAVLDHVHA